MKRLNASISLFLMVAFLLPGLAFAQNGVPARDEIYAKIRKEGSENSKVMNTIHYFTDLYGPRLTGSPNYNNAAKWGTEEMKRWGFDNTFLEPWEFGYPGWVNERNTGMIVAPMQDTLVYEVLAWTPSTKGAVTGDAFHIQIPQFPAAENPRVMQNPTQAELTAYFDSIKSAINGKIVLVGKHTFVDQTTPQAPKRINDDVVRCRADVTKTPQECAALAGTPAGPQQGPPRQAITPRPNALNPGQINEQLDKFLLDNGVLVRINESQLDRGLVRAFNNRTFDVTKVVPTVVLRNEDFGRITRLLASKVPVRLEFDIRNRTVPETQSYNMIGEIYGTDKKDEVIMLGGHLDSWHSATGATDNAVGCATMMEAARILKAIGVKPRRTIRVACWAGEEQGLLGSQAYVKKHFGSFENPTAEYSKFGGYFNIDSGTGKARILTVFGPPEAAAVLRDALAPFSDFGFGGVVPTSSRGLGGTDSTSFNNAGLPGIGSTQDPIEYFAGTWHTNIDTYERIIEDDVKKSAMIFAAGVYTLAMRDELLPRFAPDKMPKPPAAN